MLAVAALVPACSHRTVPENFQIAVPAAFPPTAALEIPLGIGDVVEVSYFKSYDVKEPYRLAAGDALEIVLRPVNLSEPYRLGVGDQLAVIVKGASGGGAYQLQVGDEVNVVV